MWDYYKSGESDFLGEVRAKFILSTSVFKIMLKACLILLIIAFFFFLSKVLIDMANANVDGSVIWYPLSPHDDSSNPLGSLTPIQSPTTFRQNHGSNASGE